MPTTKEYRDYILEKLSNLTELRFKPMMGEYLLYYKDILFGGIYDNRLLVKITDTNNNLGLEEEYPYPGAKPMFIVSDIDDRERLEKIILLTYNGLIK